MTDFEVYLEANFEGHDEHFYWRGSRFDVYVKTGGLIYNLEFDVMSVIKAEVKYCHDRGQFYRTSNNLILVEDVSVNTILQTVKQLHEQGYFLQTRPVDVTNMTLTLANPLDYPKRSYI